MPPEVFAGLVLVDRQVVEVSLEELHLRLSLLGSLRAWADWLGLREALEEHDCCSRDCHRRDRSLARELLWEILRPNAWATHVNTGNCIVSCRGAACLF